MHPDVELIDAAEEAADSLMEIVDYSETANVEVGLDAVASAFQALQGPRRSVRPAVKLELADVLVDFVEEHLVRPAAVTLADEVTTLIDFKNYEGYSEEYVGARLSSLISDLHDELKAAIQKLRTQAHG